MSEELVIYGVRFARAAATLAIVEKIDTVISNGRYRQRYHSFECPFYSGAVIATLSLTGITPVGVTEKWVVNSEAASWMFLSIDQIAECNKKFRIKLNDANVKQYAACISRTFYNLEGMPLVEPRSLEELRKSGIGAESLVEVQKAARGWSARSYHIERESEKVVIATYRIPSNGAIRRDQIEVEVRSERALAKFEFL